MNKHQRQMIKEAYQEGYYQALDEGLGGAIRLLKNLFRGGKASKATRSGLINFGGNLPEPNDPTPFKRQASILFDRLMNSLNTDVNNYYISLGPDAVEIVDKIRASIIGLESSVRAGEITNNQAISKLMRRHPAFFDNFGTATGSRFDDLPGLDP